ncbi:hypothetical protein SSBR45G_16300 [Bradyrhizobium sp. SSBR45G]|uniref:hypothetical protein n=1 Tax=unclassified Bradyrhizobium TaxID=2631580 RepID=UPI00234296E6|nr:MULTISPECIES: hypothetical protein [unclassified Bradyrhizobium]GLH76722.1 hypothetical protein SSBR45G_16300 [Bradyrhizobium sp. SSBR45G]GLH83480.1 hypothetical protein SSBR45R_09400 [Bradyrhizobium sp. SSBR45R]
MGPVDRIWEFLQRLSPLTRSCLLSELERLELSGVDMPGSADLQARLRAEIRKDGASSNRAINPSRYFFMPIEQLLVDGSPEHANEGRIARGSLTPIWEWISRDLLPTMARDYNAQMKDLIAADKQREIRQAASAFQTKVTKSLEGTLARADGIEQVRSKLKAYTASPSVFDDVVKLMKALRAREELAKFADSLPDRIAEFDDPQVKKMVLLLDGLRKKQPEAVPFALTLVAKRLKEPWQVMRLATKAARTKNVTDVITAPYAMTVPMVLDQLEDKRLALRVALKNNRVVTAKEILTSIYDIEYAIQVRIDRIEESDWGHRLSAIMSNTAKMVQDEVKRFPEDVGHVLGSNRLRSHRSLGDRLTYIAWKGRDAIKTALRSATG